MIETPSVEQIISTFKEGDVVGGTFKPGTFFIGKDYRTATRKMIMQDSHVSLDPTVMDELLNGLAIRGSLNVNEYVGDREAEKDFIIYTRNLLLVDISEHVFGGRLAERPDGKHYLTIETLFKIGEPAAIPTDIYIPTIAEVFKYDKKTPLLAEE